MGKTNIRGEKFGLTAERVKEEENKDISQIYEQMQIL